jgi:hypothetical protein
MRLEGSVGSFPNLVQLILQRIDLALQLLEGRASGCDEQTPVLALGVSGKGNRNRNRRVWRSKPGLKLKGL